MASGDSRSQESLVHPLSVGVARAMEETPLHRCVEARKGEQQGVPRQCGLAALMSDPANETTIRSTAICRRSVPSQRGD
jgi:hypothetical protein